MGGRRRQLTGTKEDQLLVGVAGHWIPRPEPRELLRHAADFFLTLAPRRILGRFTGVDASRRKLPQLTIDRRAILLDQDDAAIVLNGDEHDRRSVPHDRDLMLTAVRVAALLDLDGKHPPLIDDRHGSAPSAHRARAVNPRAARSRIPSVARRSDA